MDWYEWSLQTMGIDVNLYDYTHSTSDTNPTAAELANSAAPVREMSIVAEAQGVANIASMALNERYQFTRTEFERLCIYRAAIRAGHFNEGAE